MTESEIVNRLFWWTDSRKFPWQLSNSFIYKWECDYWTMTQGGETREFEIKISRSDYLVDAKKDKHKSTDGANYFYYVCPEGLIKKDEVDSRYGLIYIDEDNRLTIIKKPKRLHSNVFNSWKILANKMYWKFQTLWVEKLRSKEITRHQYWEGFNIQLEEFELLNSEQEVQASVATDDHQGTEAGNEIKLPEQ